jgi:transposase
VPRLVSLTRIGRSRTARRSKRPDKRRIVGGVDTHADTHHAAVELMNGGRIADARFPAHG